MCSSASPSCSGQRAVARGEALAERQQIEQQLDEQPWIARDVAAVVEHLPGKLRRRGSLSMSLICRSCPASDSVANASAINAQQARIAGGGIAPGAGKLRQLAPEAGGDGAVRLLVGVFEQQVGVRQPGDEPARGDGRLRGNAAIGAESGSIHSSASWRPVSRASSLPAASRLRSQPKPCSSRAQAALGGSMTNGERPRRKAMLPARPNWPCSISCQKLGSAVRRSGGTISR